jgi:hypothetical protein
MTKRKSKRRPRTVEEAVELVMAEMPDKVRAWLRQLKGEEQDVELQIMAANFGAGMWVRALAGLWKNQELIEQFPWPHQHADSASSYLLMECWRRLRQNDAVK